MLNFMILLTDISILFLLYWCVVNQYIVVKWNFIVKKFNENIAFGMFITCMLFWLQYVFQMFFDRWLVFYEVNRHNGVCKILHCVYFFRTNYSLFLASPPTSPPNLKKTNQKGGPNHSWKPPQKKKETPSSCYYSQPR